MLEARGCGVTCDSYTEWLELLEPGAGPASLIVTSPSEDCAPPGRVVKFEVWTRWLGRPFLPMPSRAPTFFHPLLCMLMARCSWLLGDEPNPQSEVGGVVGGVRGSPDGEAELPLSSDPASRSVASVDAERLFASPLLPMVNGRKDALGERLDSSPEDDLSLGILRRGRPNLESLSWPSSPV